VTGAIKTGKAGLSVKRLKNPLVKSGDKTFDVSTPEKLKAILLADKGIDALDPIKAEAGIHMMNVLKALGLGAELDRKLHPNVKQITTMNAMAEGKRWSARLHANHRDGVQPGC
jgi:hypothetical protein